MIIKKSLMIATASLALVGCGGGGGDNPVNPGNPDNPTIGDTTPPVITLVGDSLMEIKVGTKFVDPGALATDDVDGDVPVQTSGTVDENTIGTYSIKYTSSDKSNNISEKSRTVKVVDVLTGVEKTVIDAMAIYSPGAKSMYGGDVSTRLSHLIAFTNIINENSDVPLVVNLVYSEERGMDDTLNSDIILQDIKGNADVLNTRIAHSADEVLIFRPYANDGMCGLAYINTPLAPEYAYAHITIDCPSDTTAHEMGHNYGLSHSHKQPGSGIFSYSFGHGVDNEFATTMSYASKFNVSENEPIYSNPRKNDCKGQPCGIEEGYDGEADAARTVNEVKDAISKYY